MISEHSAQEKQGRPRIVEMLGATSECKLLFPVWLGGREGGVGCQSPALLNSPSLFKSTFDSREILFSYRYRLFRPDPLVRQSSVDLDRI